LALLYSSCASLSTFVVSPVRYYTRALFAARAGRASVHFAITTARLWPPPTVAIFTAVGNPAPPRPRSPARSMASMSSVQGLDRGTGGRGYWVRCSARLCHHSAPETCRWVSRLGAGSAGGLTGRAVVVFKPGGTSR